MSEEKAKAIPVVEIYTDGGCQGNPGVGGWGVVLRYKTLRRQFSGGSPATTNNRMELTAAIEALKALLKPCAVHLHTDSEYVRNGITKWLAGWRRNGWKTSTKQPVKNADLWRELESHTIRHTVTWKWVKGHAGVPENEACDQLATAAMQEIRKQYSAAELSAKLKIFKEREEE